MLCCLLLKTMTQMQMTCRYPCLKQKSDTGLCTLHVHEHSDAPPPLPGECVEGQLHQQHLAIYWRWMFFEVQDTVVVPDAAAASLKMPVDMPAQALTITCKPMPWGLS